MPEIHVNGRTYELVPLDEITLDEAIVLWDYAKISLDQIPDQEGFHPGVTAALIHIAVARVETGETPKTIRQTVGRLKVSDLEQIFADISEETEADAALPPPSASSDEPSSSGSSGGSGADSSPIGEPPPEPSTDAASGSPGSGTGATSDRLTSAA